MSIISSFVHEMGHIAAILGVNKSEVSEINLGFLNVDIINKIRNNFLLKENILILISGVISNFLISIFSFSLYLLFKIENFMIFSCINLFIGILNIMPISVLDGGQIFFLMLRKKVSIESSILVSQIISILFLLPLSTLGFFILLRSKYNYSLLILSCYLIFCMVLKEDVCF